MQRQQFFRRVALAFEATVQATANLRLPLRVIPPGTRTKIFRQLKPVVHGQGVNRSL